MENVTQVINNEMYHALKNDLKEVLQGKLVIIGVGNPMRGDDAAGNELAARLSYAGKYDCITCEETPENYTADIILKNPDTVLIIDAVNLNQNPGDIVLLKPEQLSDECFDTHKIPLSVFITYLKNFVKNRIYILGIQPKNTGYINFLSDEVSGSMAMLEKLFNDLSESKN